MVFNFRLISDEVDHFKREIQIDADDTFLDLHNAICEAVGYSKNEMSSFFLCNDAWEKEKEITLEDMGMDDNDDDVYLMDECILSDFIDDEGQRLMFTFDYLNDRSFFMEMKSMQTGRKLHEPVCTLSLGTPPAQELPMEDFAATTKAVTATTIDDFDDNVEEEVGFNPEEFDAEGYSEISDDL